MRNIDYITNQLIFFFVNSDNLIMNDDLDLEAARREKRQPLECSDSFEKVIDKFFCPTFIDIQIIVADFQAYFRPWPWMDEFLRINVTNAEVFNRQIHTAERFLAGVSPIKNIVQKLWSESWFIIVHQAFIEYCCGKDTTLQLSQKFKYVIDFNRLMWIPDIKMVFPQFSKFKFALFYFNFNVL